MRGGRAPGDLLHRGRRADRPVGAPGRAAGRAARRPGRPRHDTRRSGQHGSDGASPVASAFDPENFAASGCTRPAGIRRPVSFDVPVGWPAPAHCSRRATPEPRLVAAATCRHCRPAPMSNWTICAAMLINPARGFLEQRLGVRLLRRGPGSAGRVAGEARRPGGVGDRGAFPELPTAGSDGGSVSGCRAPAGHAAAGHAWGTPRRCGSAVPPRRSPTSPGSTPTFRARTTWTWSRTVRVGGQ